MDAAADRRYVNDALMNSLNNPRQRELNSHNRQVVNRLEIMDFISRPGLATNLQGGVIIGVSRNGRVGNGDG